MQQPPRAIAYLRVSSIGQQKHGHNLDSQLEAVRAYCKTHGYAFRGRELNDKDVHLDIVSGTRTDRNGYYRLLARIERADADVIVTFEVSRFGRNDLDGVWLKIKAKEYGLRIESVGSGGRDYLASPEGEFMYDILSAVAKYERNAILHRLTRGKTAGVKRGRWVNGMAPFGYRAEGPSGAKVLTPHPREAPVAREVFERFLAGESQRKIAEWLNTLQLPRAYGDNRGPRRWSSAMIARILDNPVYAGKVAYDGDVAEGQHTPLLTPEEWETTRKRREEHTRYWYRGGGRKKTPKPAPPSSRAARPHSPPDPLRTPHDQP